LFIPDPDSESGSSLIPDPGSKSGSATLVSNKNGKGVNSTWNLCLLHLLAHQTQNSCLLHKTVLKARLPMKPFVNPIDNDNSKAFKIIGFFSVSYSTLFHLPPPQMIPLCRRMLGWNPGLLQLRHWQSNTLTTRLDLIHITHLQLGWISSTYRLDLITARLDLIHSSARSHPPTWPDLIHNSARYCPLN
jgi:hypothetical protein